MKKRMKKQWFTMLLIVVLVLSMAGCQKESKSNDVSQGNSNTSSENGGSDTNSEDDVPTFTIATVRWTDSWPIEYLESGAMKELEEKYGVNIEWQVYYNSDWDEQKSLLLASGDLPDAFFGSICLSESDISLNKEYFLELTDLIDTNMPNLSAIFDQDPVLKAAAQNRDGEIYSLVKRLPLRPVVANSMYINQEWLDNLGLDLPTTYTELESVLYAFANEDADGDGDPSNEIPYTNAGSLRADINNLLSSFRTIASRTGNYMQLDKEGKPAFVPITDQYIEAVKWAHELYANGVLDAEYFTQDTTMASAKRMADGGSQTGLVYAWTADSEMGQNTDQFVLCEAVEGPDGNRYVESDPTFLNISNRELVVTNQCENPEKLLQWADAFYTDLVSLQTYYGSIPGQIAANDDGTYKVLLPSDGSSFDTSAWSNSMRDFGPKYMTEAFQSNVILPESEGDGVKLAQDKINAPYAKEVVFPVVQYTTDQYESLALLATDIYKYVESQYANWVINGNVDEEWENYIDQLNKMGLEEMLSIQEDAYNAYLDLQ